MSVSDELEATAACAARLFKRSETAEAALAAVTAERDEAVAHVRNLLQAYDDVASQVPPPRFGFRSRNTLVAAAEEWLTARDAVKEEGK